MQYATVAYFLALKSLTPRVGGAILARRKVLRYDEIYDTRVFCFCLLRGFAPPSLTAFAAAWA